MGLLRACLALAVVVPVALALSRCPCPAAPAAARVCGSDLKTHDSQCHLMECADHGVTAVHPGPCSLLEHPMTHLAMDSVRHRHRPRRSPASDLVQCIENQTCRDASGCGCVAPWDAACRWECEANCLCGCAGRPRRGVATAAVRRCLEERRCLARAEACRRTCRGRGVSETSACRSCVVSFILCLCGCGSGSAGPRGRAARDTRSAVDVDEYRLSDVDEYRLSDVTDRGLALGDLNLDDDVRDWLGELSTEQPAAGGTRQPEPLVRFGSPPEIRSWTPNLGDGGVTGYTRTLVGRGAAAVGLAVFYGCYYMLRRWLCQMLHEEPAHV